MSNRFLGLCLAILIISNIFFYNFYLESITPTNQDIILGKILNQSNHWLIFFYILLNKKISKNEPVIKGIFLIFFLEFGNEFFNYFYPKEDTITVDCIFFICEKIIWILIFIKLGTNIYSIKKSKNILNLIFALSLFFFSYKAIQTNTETNQSTILNLTMFSVMIFVISASNLKENYFHYISLGALLIAFGDIAFLYSGFLQDVFWKFLYLMPRFFISMGELMITFKILEELNPKENQ